jgi:hypothetical protein
MKKFKDFLIEARKSGDYSLRDWFSKSKASDGTPGWVQLGGKYAGKPCARQPGQTTKPKCGSSKMAAEMSKDEEDKAVRKKRKKDPNPERTGKAKFVATEEKKDHEYSMARSELDIINNAVKRIKKKIGKNNEGNLKSWVQSKITKGADYIDTAADYVTNEQKDHMKNAPSIKNIEEEGKKDACYKKVKSRYKIWPSAYASGALVKCRKVGSKNWGNKTKNEEYLEDDLIEKYLRIQTRGTTYTIILNWRGKNITSQMFFQQFTRPTKEEIRKEINKIYPGSIVLYYYPSAQDPTKPLLFTGDANRLK